MKRNRMWRFGLDLLVLWLPLVVAGPVAAVGFNPFEWEAAGIEAEGPDEYGTRTFTHEGVKWAVTVDGEIGGGRGRYGEWSVNLRWNYLGEPAAFAATYSLPMDAAQILSLIYDCGPDEPPTWKMGVGWNYYTQGDPSLEESRRFSDTQAMRGGRYKLRFDAEPTRKIWMTSPVPKDGWGLTLLPAKIESPEDNAWLTREVRARHVLRMEALRWGRIDQRSNWLEGIQAVKFSLEGSRKILDAADAWCSGPGHTFGG